MSRILCLIIVFSMCMYAHALTTDQYQFSSPLQQQRFDNLSHELRCLVCQNESLADSNAALAQDLRLQIVSLIKQGNSDKQIIQYFVNRYGDFVLYQPPLQTTTWLLWFAPAILLTICLIIIIVIIRAAKKSSSPSMISDSQQRNLAAILNSENTGNRS